MKGVWDAIKAPFRMLPFGGGSRTIFNNKWSDSWFGKFFARRPMDDSVPFDNSQRNNAGRAYSSWLRNGLGRFGAFGMQAASSARAPLKRLPGRFGRIISVLTGLGVGGASIGAKSQEDVDLLQEVLNVGGSILSPFHDESKSKPVQALDIASGFAMERFMPLNTMIDLAMLSSHAMTFLTGGGFGLKDEISNNIGLAFKNFMSSSDYTDREKMAVNSIMETLITQGGRGYSEWDFGNDFHAVLDRLHHLKFNPRSYDDMDEYTRTSRINNVVNHMFNTSVSGTGEAMLNPMERAIMEYEAMKKVESRITPRSTLDPLMDYGEIFVTNPNSVANYKLPTGQISDGYSQYDEAYYKLATGQISEGYSKWMMRLRDIKNIAKQSGSTPSFTELVEMDSTPLAASDSLMDYGELVNPGIRSNQTQEYTWKINNVSGQNAPHMGDMLAQVFSDSIGNALTSEGFLRKLKETLSPNIGELTVNIYNGNGAERIESDNDIISNSIINTNSGGASLYEFNTTGGVR